MNKITSKNIYAIKGIGALLIMIYHYSVHYNTYIGQINIEHFNFAYLTFAVPMFFLFSSFFLYGKTLTYLNPCKLILYRLTRLYPMYWIAVLFSSFMIIVIGKERLSIMDIIINLTMIEKVFGIEHIDGAYWTMFYELMLLVVLAGASIISINKARIISKPFILCSSWLALGAVSAAFLKIFNIKSSAVAVLLFACRYVPVFVMGILFYNRYKQEKRIDESKFRALYICSIVYELILGQNIYHGIYGIIAILIGHITISGKLNNIRLFSLEVLVFLGKISYNIYLCHNQFGRILISKFSGVKYNTFDSFMVLVVIGTLAIVAAFCFSLIEKKVIKEIEHFTKFT